MSTPDFMLFQETLWVNLDKITTIDDESKDKTDGSKFKVRVTFEDGLEPLVLKGDDAVRLMQRLGLPMAIGIPRLE